MAEASCQHLDRDEGPCPACGACLHDVILNGACYYCGETDLKVTVKPAVDVIPIERLLSKLSK